MVERTYRAICEHDRTGDAWLVRIDCIDGCHTHGRSSRQAEHRIREALALWLDRDLGELTVMNE